jgi:ankyrin repeat protein
MQRLVAHGADPLLPAADDTTPLMAAAGLGTVAPGEEAGTEPEVLEAVRLIVALGADLNAVNDDGDTAMHGAAYKNLPQVVRLLDELGADIAVWNRRNEHGWTPLRIAEGYRFGNFKPSPETVSALHEVMRAHGVEPPRGTDQDAGGKQIYR